MRGLKAFRRSERDPAGAGYLDFFTRRLTASHIFEQEAKMHTSSSFDYAILRVVPRVERQNFMNAESSCCAWKNAILAARIHLIAIV